MGNYKPWWLDENEEFTEELTDKEHDNYVKSALKIAIFLMSFFAVIFFLSFIKDKPVDFNFPIDQNKQKMWDNIINDSFAKMNYNLDCLDNLPVEVHIIGEYHRVIMIENDALVITNKTPEIKVKIAQKIAHELKDGLGRGLKELGNRIVFDILNGWIKVSGDAIGIELKCRDELGKLI